MPRSALSEKLASSKSDMWETPRPLARVLGVEFDIAVDLAALRTNKRFRYYLGPDHATKKYRDALRVDWTEYLLNLEKRLGRRTAGFYNPPFSLLEKFVEKTVGERVAGCPPIIALLPHKTETVWYHELARYADEVRILRARLKHNLNGVSDSAFFASAVAVFNGRAPMFQAPRFSFWDWRHESTGPGRDR